MVVSAVAAAVYKRCSGEVCSAILADAVGDQVAGVVADLAVAAVASVEAVVSVEALVVAVILVEAALVGVGKQIQPILTDYGDYVFEFKLLKQTAQAFTFTLNLCNLCNRWTCFDEHRTSTQ